MLVGRRGISPVMIGRPPPEAAAVGWSGTGRRPSTTTSRRSPSSPVRPASARPGSFEELIGSIPAGTTVLVAQADPGSLGRPLDLVRSMLGDSPTDLVDARAVGGRRVAERLGDGRSLVIFEDLHWADSDSVGVFEQLAAMPLPG